MARVTIKDVARELNIAVGTVSKALNGKTGVSAETRAAVEETAKRMGYNANPLAQSLVRRPLRIGVILPGIWQEFYGYLRKGIDRQMEGMLDHRLHCEYIFISGLNAIEEITTGLRKFHAQAMDAVIVCPAFDMDYEEELKRLKDAGIPVIILGNRMESQACLTTIYSDARKAGALAADYARTLIRENETAAVLIGKESVWDHKEKVKGFKDGLDCPVEVLETYDKPEVAYKLCLRLLEEKPRLRVLYVATGNSIAVCKAVKESGNTSIKVIATDIFPEMRTYVQQRVIGGIIFQDLLWQGGKAVKVICDYLTQGKTPLKEIRTFPQIAFKSNFEDYLAQMER